MNLPNTITVLRALLVAPFVLLAYGTSDTAAYGALAIFVVASLTDHLDGYLARKHGTVSSLGEFLDPFVDKLLVGAALIVLIDVRLFPVWAAAIIVVREIAVLALRMRIAGSGGRLPASPAAKAKTALQLLMVSWWLLPWDGVTAIHDMLVAAVVAMTLWSGAEYFAAFMRRTRIAS